MTEGGITEAPHRRLDAIGLRRSLPAGVLDAGMASLATFITGLVAVRVFDDATTGIYAVFFTAFLFGHVLALNLIYLPSEIAAVGRPLGERLDIVPQSVSYGLTAGIVGAMASAFAVAVTFRLADASTLIALSTTAAAAIVLSPTQDHVRRMLHIDGLSWAAVAVSGVQLAVAIGAVGGMLLADINRAWIPFGALSMANATSLGTGVVLAHRRRGSHRTLVRLDVRRLLRAGAWLLVGALIPAGVSLIGDAIVIHLAGEEALGYAEAARVVAMPVLVVAIGLSAVIGPRMMEAAIARNAAASRRVFVLFLLITGAGAVLYAAVAGFDWPLNPMSYLVPRAYTVGGLVLVTVAMHYIVGAFLILNSELIAARKEKSIAVVAATAAPMRLLLSATAAVTGAFARPVAYLGQSVVSVAGYGTLRHRHYRQDSADTAAAAPAKIEA